MKNPFVRFQKSPWAIPVFVLIGLIVGALIAGSAVWWATTVFIQQATVGVGQGQEEVMEEQQEMEEDQIEYTEEDGEYQIDVTWEQNARKLTNDQALTVLTSDTVGSSADGVIRTAFRTLVSEEGATGSGDDYEPWETWKFVGMWEVGEVQSAPWNAASVYHLRFDYQTMGGGYEHLYLIRLNDGSSKVFAVGTPPEGLQRGSAVQDVLRGVTFLPNASIRGLELPKEIVLENGEHVSHEETGPFWGNEVFRFDGIEGLRQVTRTRDGLPVYESREQSDSNQAGCLYVFAPDGRRVEYRSGISRAEPNQEEGFYQGRLRMNWDTAYARADEVDYMERLYSGCGGYACTSIVSDQEARAEGGLTRAGTTDEGDPVYVPTRPQDRLVVQELYDGWYIPDGGDKPSIEVMIQKYPAPVFYWQDALGRWVEYRALGILPLAECGKPVIYLYPEQTTDISVRLPSFIDVTVSEPTYPSAGWHVTAEPNGQLTNHTDGNTYGSLYWEGTGVGYAPPKDGFIVKDGEVESFLRNTLPRYGLNQTETREFMEFWVPEMQGAPYYRVSFLTSAWSAAAPLFVSPQPQTSIRIFMDWRPLSAPVSLPEPEITTPARNGFTLVEWGGTLWK